MRARGRSRPTGPQQPDHDLKFAAFLGICRSRAPSANSGCRQGIRPLVKIPDGMREAGKERRRRERRRAIALACHERLAAEGLAAATLDDLARDAGLSNKHLLFYFADKADLWNAAVVAAAEVHHPDPNHQ